MRWFRSVSRQRPACWAGIHSWDIFEVAWIVAAVAIAAFAAAVAVAVTAVAVAGSGSRRSAAAGNSAWWVRKEALRTVERERPGLNCYCSWRFGHWRTVRGRRLGERRMAATWFKRRTGLARGGFRRLFWRKRRSFERVERHYRVRRHTGVLGAAAGG